MKLLSIIAQTHCQLGHCTTNYHGVVSSSTAALWRPVGSTTFLELSAFWGLSTFLGVSCSEPGVGLNDSLWVPSSPGYSESVNSKSQTLKHWSGTGKRGLCHQDTPRALHTSLAFCSLRTTSQKPTSCPKAWSPLQQQHQEHRNNIPGYAGINHQDPTGSNT